MIHRESFACFCSSPNEWEGKRKKTIESRWGSLTGFETRSQLMNYSRQQPILALQTLVSGGAFSSYPTHLVGGEREREGWADGLGLPPPAQKSLFLFSFFSFFRLLISYFPSILPFPSSLFPPIFLFLKIRKWSVLLWTGRRRTARTGNAARRRRQRRPAFTQRD